MHAHFKKFPVAKKILASAISVIALVSLSGSLYAKIGGAGEELPDNFAQPNGTFNGPPTTLKLGVNWAW